MLAHSITKGLDRKHVVVFDNRTPKFARVHLVDQGNLLNGLASATSHIQKLKYENSVHRDWESWKNANRMKMKHGDALSVEKRKWLLDQKKDWCSLHELDKATTGMRLLQQAEFFVRYRALRSTVTCAVAAIPTCIW